MQYFQLFKINYLTLFFSCTIFFNREKGKEPIPGYTDHQQKQNAFFKMPPNLLTKKQLKSFKSLPFLNWIVVL